MKQRYSKNLLFLLFIGLTTAFVVSGTNLIAARVRNSGPPFIAVSDATQENSIIRENELQGTTNWAIPRGHESTIQIQAYADTLSVLPGQKLTFYVSTMDDNTLYSIGIYRLGWYNGDGGRLLAVYPNLVGHAQGYYNASMRLLSACYSCTVDAKTGLAQANWQPSYTVSRNYDKSAIAL